MSTPTYCLELLEFDLLFNGIAVGMAKIGLIAGVVTPFSPEMLPFPFNEEF